MIADKSEVEDFEQFLWLQKEIVPKIAEALGKDDGYLECKIQRPVDCVSISSIFMVELTFSGENGMENEKMELMIKTAPSDESTRSYMRTDILFHNEIIFYQLFGKNYNDYPRCVLAIPEPITSAVIVMENVTQFGYKSVQLKDIKMKHALAAVREIGKFHARGYILKEKNPTEFFKVAKATREVHDDSDYPALIEYINAVSLRPVNYLRSVNYDPEFCEKMSTFLSKAHENVLQDCLKSRNELAVLCHGDFTSSNVLFKEDHGEFKAMLIDFAQLRYASPATDVSTFLYLGCDDEVRKNFPVIYKAYHDTIFEYLKDQGIQDLEKYSFDAFLKDYKRHALYGCGTALFFIPIMHLDDWKGFEHFSQNKSECFEKTMVSGGDKISKKLADVLVELKDNGCLNHIIENGNCCTLIKTVV